MFDALIIPDEADLPPDEKLTRLQRQVLGEIWSLTDARGGAWVDGAIVLGRVPHSASPLTHLIARGILECQCLGAGRRPHSRHAWPVTRLYRLTKDGYAEIALTMGASA